MNFYDGIIIGSTNNSITGSGTVNYASGYTKKVTNRGDGTEVATLGWETTASDTQLINDSNQYTGSSQNTQYVVIKEYVISH